MISSKKSLVALKSLMEVSKSNVDIAQTFFHHCNINVGGSRIWMRWSTSQMQEIQCTIDIPMGNRQILFNEKQPRSYKHLCLNISRLKRQSFSTMGICLVHDLVFVRLNTQRTLSLLFLIKVSRCHVRFSKFKSSTQPDYQHKYVRILLSIFYIVKNLLQINSSCTILLLHIIFLNLPVKGQKISKS